ncbi:Calcium-transporting ATPase [Aphelenchoides fujianensis]|nr:Calcium-transporting ATPase [Aphelenchoides fujianensis]
MSTTDSKLSSSGARTSGFDATTATPTEVDCTLEQLRNLMKLRGEEARKAIDRDWGGIGGLCAKLAVDPRHGLHGTEDTLEQRRAIFGANEIPGKKPKNFLQLVFKAMKDTTLIILLICGLFSLSLCAIPSNRENDTQHSYAWIEGVAILVCVALVVLATSINDYTKERQFRALQARIAVSHEFTAIRDGQPVEVNPKKLVVGDVVQVKYGDLLPADGVIVQSHDLRLDEASLTGETDHVKKAPEGDPVLLSGTHVMEGSGKMVVTAVGVNSQTGIIMTLMGATGVKSTAEPPPVDENTQERERRPLVPKTSGPSEQSLLQQKLNRLTLHIGYFGMSIASCTSLILILRYCIVRFVLLDDSWDWSRDVSVFAMFVVVGVTVLVVAVPEGLPLAVTLSLAYSVRRMTKDHNLVRHLAACETMGNATVICSDKTGTLTTNRMTVVRAYVNGTTHKTPRLDEVEQKTADILTHAIAINSAYSAKIAPPAAPGEQPKHIGNKTECGMLAFLQDGGRDYVQIRATHPEEMRVSFPLQLLTVYTFNSARKSMTTILRNEWDERGGFRVFTKGAAEIVLKKCAFWLGRDGVVREFGPADLQHVISEVVEPMAADSLRTICVAYRDFYPAGVQLGMNETAYERPVDWDKEDEVVGRLTMLAVLGIQDPVRPEVPNAIKQCQEAGISVIMVTGDNIGTARAIARDCGILPPAGSENEDEVLALESREFNERIRENGNGEVVQELFDEVWPRLHVLARAQPADKFTLVAHIIASHLRDGREVVAVTGDGTNDAPALKKADVGFAMGIAGTDVAKEASDIIVTDDNFSSIVTAVMWGRNVYDSIAKFLQFQLTVNVVAVLVVFVGVCFAEVPPLKAVQILWVNLLIDTLGALALSTERPTAELLQRKPYGRMSPIVSPRMARNIIGQAVYQLAVLLTLTFAGEKIFRLDRNARAEPLYADPTEHFTMVFNTFVMMTLFNEINARKIHNQRNIFAGLFTNWMNLCIWFLSFAAQFVFVHWGGNWFSTANLNWWQWLVCVGFGVGTCLVISVPSGWIPLSFGVAAHETESTKALKRKKRAAKKSAREAAKTPKAEDA